MAKFYYIKRNNLKLKKYTLKALWNLSIFQIQDKINNISHNLIDLIKIIGTIHRRRQHMQLVHQETTTVVEDERLNR